MTMVVVRQVGLTCRQLELLFGILAGAMREMQLIKSLRKQRTANSHMITRARLTVNAINVARDQILELDSMKDRTKLFKTITGGRDIAGEMEDAIADDDEMLADADEMMDTMIGSGLPAGMDEEELEADLATIMAGGEEVPGAVATPPATTATPMPGIPAMPGLPAATTTPAMPIAPTAAATAAPASAEADFAGLEDLMG